MPSVIKRRLAVSCLLVLLTGCSGDAESPDRGTAKPVPTASSGAGYGDILVGGEPVTGSKPSGNRKIPYQRTYAEGELYAFVTGHRSLSFGTSGVEALREESLTHRKGEDVATTIDPKVQKAAFAALGERRGAAVALNARTGALLAVVSTPSHDPGTFSGFSYKDAEAWEELNGDRNKPLLNRALREATPPGETFDLVIAAAALEHGLYDTADEPVAGGSGECANATIRAALVRSCHDVFARLAAELGEEKLRATAEAFGFGDAEVEVPVRAAESEYGSYRDGSVTVTPLQLARVTAAFANRGLMAAPHMVAGETGGRAARSVPASAAGLLLPALREKETWAPTADADGAPSAWSITLARTGGGDPVALAARVAAPDGAGAARVTAAMTAALS
ncbi:penicillin-binding transpeptidase domain-containing protein [Streptomyces sp. CAU 1734]|uniref:penicillin-binding transpeptidase domain-containing protein n=1 Tax=Streptomyces sp. CAU 1734 TaxID=3140360 RepID=UPI003260A227